MGWDADGAQMGHRTIRDTCVSAWGDTCVSAWGDTCVSAWGDIGVSVCVWAWVPAVWSQRRRTPMFFCTTFRTKGTWRNPNQPKSRHVGSIYCTRYKTEEHESSQGMHHESSQGMHHESSQGMHHESSQGMHHDEMVPAVSRYQLYQIKATVTHTYCMVFTTWKTGKVGYRYGKVFII